MAKGKIMVIEGTDCSGKETQASMLVESLKKDGFRIEKFGFPNYESPTGKIIGGPYLGKSHICEGWFSEGASNVPPKVASLYYLADRIYNAPIINELLEGGINVVIDRYVESNMGHQGGKIYSKEQRNEMFEWLYNIEYRIGGLPIPDKIIFLYMPYKAAVKLSECRKEEPDQHESQSEYLKNSEKAYLELSNKYGFEKIDCVVYGNVRSKEDIHNDVYNVVKKII